MTDGNVRQPFFAVRNLKKYFPVRAGVLRRVSAELRAVDGIDFEVPPGMTMGLVGESGCGKTTTARMILHLETPSEGQIVLEGVDTVKVSGRVLKRHGQLVGPDLRSIREKLSASRDRIIAGGAKKGFLQGEAIMNNVFPLDRKMSLMVWLAAMIIRSPFKKLQDKFIEYVTRSVE